MLVCDSECITYDDAERRSAHLAHSLIALGAGKGTHVGLLYPNGVAFVVAMLAAARIGAVVVPFSTLATASEIRTQLVHSDVAILLATASFRSHSYEQRLAEIVPGRDLRCGKPLFSSEIPQLRHVVFDAGLPKSISAPLEPFESDVDGADPLAIIYTSGSTSDPKGVVHTHEALLTHQRNLNEIRCLSTDDRLFCTSPFFWIGGFAFGLLATLVAGSTLVCSNATDPGAVLDLLEAEKPTVTNGFAAGVIHLTRHPSFASRDLSSMRRGNLYPIMAPDVRPGDPELRHNMLGLTEAGSVVLLSGDERDQPEARRGSFGRPAPGFEAKVVDPESGFNSDVGELCIRGPFLMQRYYRHSREECFDDDGWFHTGDLVRTDREGYYYFVGRRGSMVKTAGANVAPAEVERAIAKVSGVRAVVLGIPDATRGQSVVAVAISDETFDTATLRDALKHELSSYKIPTRVVVMRSSEVPLLSSGKVDRVALARVFDD